MEIYVKKGNFFNKIGEGKIYKKSELRINEGIEANIGQAANMQQAAIKAKQVLNQNPSVKSASTDLGKVDGETNSNSGEGLKIQVPVNANASQLDKVQQMSRGGSYDDTEVEFTKGSETTTTENTERLKKLRENSVPFTKKELKSFLISL